MTAPETVPGQAPYKTLAVVWEAEIREAQAQSAPVSDALKLARDAVIGQKLTCLRDLQRALETVVQLEQPAPELAEAERTIGRGEPHHGDPDPNSPDSFGEDLPRVSPLPSWEIEQHARDMAAEDGDFDRCEPTL